MEDKVLAKLCKYCASTDRCTQEVINKLFTLKVWEDDHEDYINYLIDNSFLDDYRYTETYVKAKFNLNKWGKIKIENHLKQKNIPDSFISKAFTEIIEDEAYEALFQELYQKKLATLQGEEPLKRKAKVLSFLSQRGFEQEKIYGLLDE